MLPRLHNAESLDEIARSRDVYTTAVETNSTKTYNVKDTERAKQVTMEIAWLEGEPSLTPEDHDLLCELRNELSQL